MKLALAPILLLFALNTSAQEIKKYTLRGVVTYYFNANYGDKPDTGAKAYLLTPEAANQAGLTPTAVFRYQLLAAKYNAAGLLVKPEKRLTEADKQLKTELKASADSLLKKQFALENSKAPYLTADGSGVFVKNLAPGQYYIFVKSAHRRGDTVAEIDGQLELKQIVVKDDDVEVPVRFGLGY